LKLKRNGKKAKIIKLAKNLKGPPSLIKMEKSLSEAAQIFLRQFNEILNDFKRETGFQVFLLNREGELISELEGVQPSCKIILSTPLGKIRCRDCFKLGFLVTKTQRVSLFLECYAGFPIGWIPITRNESVIGSIIICGGRYEKEESDEKLKEKFRDLAGELEIVEEEGFVQKVMETKLTNENEFKNSAERLKKLIDILIENVQTPIKEIFG
jgi:ligand-binding sensor protein